MRIFLNKGAMRVGLRAMRGCLASFSYRSDWNIMSGKTDMTSMKRLRSGAPKNNDASDIAKRVT